MKLHLIMQKLHRMNLHEGIMFLRAELRKETPYSVLRGELESLLAARMIKLLRKENRAA